MGEHGQLRNPWLLEKNSASWSRLFTNCLIAVHIRFVCYTAVLEALIRWPRRCISTAEAQPLSYRDGRLLSSLLTGLWNALDVNVSLFAKTATRTGELT